LLLPCGLCIICRSCYEKIGKFKKACVKKLLFSKKVPDFNKKSNYKICEFCERPHNYQNIIDLSKEYDVFFDKIFFKNDKISYKEKQYCV